MNNPKISFLVLGSARKCSQVYVETVWAPELPAGSWVASFRFFARIGTMNLKCVSALESTMACSGSRGAGVRGNQPSRTRGPRTVKCTPSSVASPPSWPENGRAVPLAMASDFGPWSLGFGVSLGIGVWDLGFPPSWAFHSRFLLLKTADEFSISAKSKPLILAESAGSAWQL
jgi:hypothetical protein